MNLRDLKYLVAIADHKHFGKAAKHCFVSQPALSMQIKKLEESLGVALIERTNKSFLLTKVGKIITEKAREIIRQVEEVKDIAREERDPLRGKLTLGVIPTLAPYLLPHIIPDLSTHFPKLTLYLVEDKTATLVEKLRHGFLDVALLALPIKEPDLIASPLFIEEFMLAVPLNHEFTKNKTVNSRDVADKAILLLEEGHCMREQTLEFCHRAKALEENCFKATSLETLRHMVATNVGITLMPKLACKEQDIVSYVPFNPPKPTRTIGLVWRRTSSKNAFFEMISEQIKELLPEQNLTPVL